MQRIDYIRAMTIKEMAEAIIEHNITDAFCKSDCEQEDECPHAVECCVRWLGEADDGFRDKVWGDDND